MDRLAEALRCLPGVGPKSAQRMIHHLLERDREGGLHLARTLADAMSRIGNCARCRNFTEAELCTVCANPSRDARVVCVVESPADLAAIERGTGFRGHYFVLMGRLSPLDGVGPAELGLDRLEARLSPDEVEELIVATGSTVEGQATAHYLSDIARARGVRVTRLAQGVPLGGELEYLDGATLAQALTGRLDFR